MNAERKAVDVLAVMDRSRDVLAEIYAKHQRAIGPFASQAQKSNGALREARAAVAELIEAGKWADEMIAQHARNEDGQSIDTTPLRAALARVGGA